MIFARFVTGFWGWKRLGRGGSRESAGRNKYGIGMVDLWVPCLMIMGPLVKLQKMIDRFTLKLWSEDI